LVDPCQAIRVKLAQGGLDLLGTGGQAQGLQGLDQFRLLAADRLTDLPRFGLARLPTFSVEQHRLPVGADARVPDFQTLLLQVRVKNRTLAGRIPGGFRKDPGLNQGIRKECVTFGTMRRFAKARGWCDGDIDGKQIRRPKAEEKPPFRTWEEIGAEIKKGGLTDAEQRDLWDCLFLREKEVLEFLAYIETKRTWLYPAIAIAVFTGARRSEILRCEAKDFDFARGVMILREKKRDHTKRTTSRRVNIPPRLAAILKAWFVNHPGGKYTVCVQPNVQLRPEDALQTFEKAVAGSKWKHLRGWHVLRHSFASICAMMGLRETTVSKWMGHETEATKQRYRHLFPEAMEAEMGRLFG
jgi:integrase